MSAPTVPPRLPSSTGGAVGGLAIPWSSPLAAGEPWKKGEQSFQETRGDFQDSGRPDEKVQRLRRFELLRAARKYTPHETYHSVQSGWKVPAIRKCRRVRVDAGVTVGVGHDGGAHLAGLSTCQSVWECPCCAQTVKIERAHEVTQVVDEWKSSGGGVYMATFTVRHGWGDGLAETCDGLMRAWKRFQQGRQWHDWRKTWRIETIRAVEVTHGKNGWHPHLHVLMLTGVPMRLDAETDAADWIYERWARCVAVELGEKHMPSAKHGTDFRKCEKAEYITKLGLELTDSADSKRCRGTDGHGRKPFEILGALADAPTPADVELWREWVEGMKGRRFMGWSRGLKLPRQRASEAWDAKREGEKAQGREVVTVPPGDWDTCRDVKGFHAALLSAAEHKENPVEWVWHTVRTYLIRAAEEAEHERKHGKNGNGTGFRMGEGGPPDGGLHT